MGAWFWDIQDEHKTAELERRPKGEVSLGYRWLVGLSENIKLLDYD